MGSAIEVLKRLVKEEGLKMSGNEMIYFNKDEFNALKEALLALEKQEKLKEWLDDTERLAKQSNKYYLDKYGVNIFGKQDYYSARIKTIKEIKKILERVGEQK